MYIAHTVKRYHRIHSEFKPIFVFSQSWKRFMLWKTLNTMRLFRIWTQQFWVLALSMRVTVPV